MTVACRVAGESLDCLLAGVFLMGTHSAFFGPSRYGLLPELLLRDAFPGATA